MLTISDLGRGTELLLDLSHDVGQRIVGGVELIEGKILSIGVLAANLFVNPAV
jgi:hypothetical protein